MQETELYAPVKDWLEGHGFDVKSEVQGCDIVARRDGEDMLIVELKTRFNMDLLLQGVDRLRLTDRVYLAFSTLGGGKTSQWQRNQREIVSLCRRLGLGLLAVGRRVDVVLDPAPYNPRKNARKQRSLMLEFDRRHGDPNIGGITRRAIVTAYRQDALRCLVCLREEPGLAPKLVKQRTGVDRAAKILQDNVYGWFERRERASYVVTPGGAAAIETFGEAISAMAE